MKKLRTIICTLLIMTVVLMPCVGYAATKTIPKPTVTVKTVNDDYIKVSWKKCTGATKYSVYRATSKTGTYKRLITTTKLYYNDKTAKNKTTYYYKVKAISKTGKVSKYSTIKSGRINFNGKITLEKDTYYISVGQPVDIPVYSSGTDDYMTAYYDDQYLDVKFVNISGNDFLRVTPVTGTIPIMDSVINIVFDGHERHYMKNLTICINTYTVPYDFKDSNVPDFGKGFLVSPLVRTADSNMFSEGYVASDIPIDANTALDLYVEELKKCGYSSTYVPSSPASIQWYKNSAGYYVAISTIDGTITIVIMK